MSIYARESIIRNIAPANGRELVAADVVFHYQREFGLGSGMTPSPYQSGNALMGYLKSATATDNYTVVFKWTISNPEIEMESFLDIADDNSIECPDAVKLWGDLNDWHHAMGTGPFLLQDVVSGSSFTFVRNPTYWAYDERYPKNQLPYVNSVLLLIIPDNSTALAALRSGKIAVTDGLTYPQAQTVMKTNPDLPYVIVPPDYGVTLNPRVDVVPFNDVRVREAMQLAIDAPSIAKTYYGGTTNSTPLSLTSSLLTGWGFPYAQWPADLQAQYAYNPTQAKQLLAAAGYPNGFKTDCVADNTADLDLLQIVQSDLANIGITMSISTLDHASWVAAVQVNHKYSQLSYTASGKLGMDAAPNVQFQQFKTGYSSNYQMVSDTTYDNIVNQEAASTSADQVKQLLQQLNQYVAQQHFAISLIMPPYFNFYQPWLHGYSGQNNGMPGASGGLQMMGFYVARFWLTPH